MCVSDIGFKCLQRNLKHVYLKTASAFLLFMKHLLMPPGVVVTITLRNSAHSNVTCLINQINYSVMKLKAAFLLMPDTKWVWHISVTALTLLVLDVFHLKTVSLCFGAKFQFQSFFCCFAGLKRGTVAFWCQFVCNRWDTAGEAVIPAPALICLSHRRCSNRIRVVGLVVNVDQKVAEAAPAGPTRDWDTSETFGWRFRRLTNERNCNPNPSMHFSSEGPHTSWSGPAYW